MVVVGIVGSRDYPHEDRVRAYVRSLPPDATVVSGGRTSQYWLKFKGRGVDVWAAEEAIACGLALIEHEPNPVHGIPACFYVRNGLIVTTVAIATAAGDEGWIAAFSKKPITPGTWSTIGQAEKAGVRVKIEPRPKGAT